MKSLVIAMGILLPTALVAQNGAVSASAKTGIDAGNQAWIDGVKSGNVPMIIATYADDAVDCGPTGECIHGRKAIEQQMKTQFASRGKALSATVTSWGSTQQGNFAYEWGLAEARYANDNTLKEKYLTAWQMQPDGSWKIFRNMVIPDR